MRPFVAFLASLLASFPGDWRDGWAQPDGARAYDVIVSPAFTVEARTAIDAAMWSWRDAVPMLRLDVLPSGTPCDATGPPVLRPVICLAPLSSEDMTRQAGFADAVGLTWHEGIRIQVRISTALDGNVSEERGCAAHELGHAMGLHHSREKGTLMYSNLPDGASAPTEADVQAWHRVRR